MQILNLPETVLRKLVGRSVKCTAPNKPCSSCLNIAADVGCLNCGQNKCLLCADVPKTYGGAADAA